MRLSSQEAIGLRLARQHLDRRAPAQDWLGVVRDVGGVQVQSMNAARMALWARVEKLPYAAIDDALSRTRTLVKTWAMRETVHLLTADDFVLFASALGPARRGRRNRLVRRGGSSDRIVSAARAARQLLAGGPLTRQELSERAPPDVRKLLKRLGPYPWDELLKDPSLLTDICFGPPRGAETVFASAPRWLHKETASSSVAQPEEQLCRRYLRAFGPATPGDFAHWSGFPIGDARGLFGRLTDDIAEVEIDGTRAWVLRDDLHLSRTVRLVSSVRLLPNFDVYLLGHKDKSPVLPAAHYKKVFPGAGRVAQTVLLNGRVVAIWTAKAAGDVLTVELEPFDELSRGVVGNVEAEANSLARFLGQRAAHVRVA